MTDYRRVIEKNGILSFTPSGNSMWPIISNRADTVIIEAPKGRLKKYDVAFYERTPEKPVLHRVLKVHPDCYDMCGDSQLLVEKGIPDQAVFGIMTGYYKKKKYIDCKKNLLYKAIVRFWSFSLFFRRCLLKGLSVFGFRAR